MISPCEALSTVLSHCELQAVEEIALAEAVGRVLAFPVRADRDLPPADRSTMDGYAVRAKDLRSAPRDLKMVGEVAAGSSARPRIKQGTCARIFTGANIPPGADAVAIVETTSEISPGTIRFSSRVEPGQNILRRGENARKGQALLSGGTYLRAQQIAVLAAVGHDPVKVATMPLVGVVCTGDELVGSAARPLRHAQRNSNGPALCAALQSLGLTERIDYGTVDDDPVALRKLLSAALNCHILIVVGGVSVGKYDLVPAALKDLGCTELLHGVAMKPGKPTFFALGPDGQLVFGLPGNPLSALTTFYEFVAPAIRKMSGLAGPPAPSVSVRLDSDVSLDDKDRTRFLPAVLAFDPNAGSPLALPIATYSSADVVAGGLCDGVLVLPVDKMHYRSGDVVEFHPWGAIL